MKKTIKLIGVCLVITLLFAIVGTAILANSAGWSKRYPAKITGYSPDTILVFSDSQCRFPIKTFDFGIANESGNISMNAFLRPGIDFKTLTIKSGLIHFIAAWPGGAPIKTDRCTWNISEVNEFGNYPIIINVDTYGITGVKSFNLSFTGVRESEPD
jgi:hypothetical protein